MHLEYAFDPLCGWCYVFGPAVRALARKCEVRISMGGLVVGERVKPMRAVRDYIEQSMPVAEARSGVRFGKRFREGLLRDDDYVMSSEPACRAIVVAGESAGPVDAQLQFALRLTEAIYRDGLRPDEPSTLAAIAREVGLDGGAFVERWAGPSARADTQAAFDAARAAGIGMYPTLRLHHDGGQIEEVLRGYALPAEALARVDRALAVFLVDRLGR